MKNFEKPKVVIQTVHRTTLCYRMLLSQADEPLWWFSMGVNFALRGICHYPKAFFLLSLTGNREGESLAQQYSPAALVPGKQRQVHF